MRVGLWISVISVAVLGCFNPDADEPIETDGNGSGSTGGPAMTMGGSTAPTTMTPSTGADGDTTADDGPMDADDGSTSDPTTGPTTTTAGVDEPPTVSLVIGGSDAPPPLTHSAVVVLEATAADDNAVAEVEFFIGDTSLGVVDSAPYEWSVLVTSLDNGDFTFTARATDDGGQEAESDPVDVTVNIAGGAEVNAETGLWQTGGLAFVPGGGATVDSEGNIIVAAAIATTGFEVVGVAAQSFSADLSATNWQFTEPASLVDGQEQYLPMGPPALSGNGDVLIIGGNAMGTDGVLDNNANIFRFASDGSGTLAPVSVTTSTMDQNIPVAGAVRDLDGSVFLAGPDESITKYGANAGGVAWASPTGETFTISDLGMFRMRPDLDGDLIVDIGECSDGTCTLATRKIRGVDGVEQWTEDIALANDDYFLSLGASATGPLANVATAFGLPAGGVRLIVRNTDGAQLENNLAVPGPDRFHIIDAAYDPQGGIVVAGTVESGGEQRGWIARLSEGGALAWQTTIEFGTDADAILGILVDDAGRLNVVGFSDLGIGFGVFLGDLWVAQYDL